MSSRGFFVRGLVFDDPQPLRGRRTVKLNSDEVPEIIERIRGKAVGVMHGSVVVGRVVDAHLSSQNDVLVDLLVDTRSPEGRMARYLVRTGVLRGLSFGSLSLLDEDCIRHTSHYPIEVSLVKEGAVDRSSIILWGDVLREVQLSKSGFLRVFTKSIRAQQLMTSEHPNKAGGEAEIPAKRMREMEEPPVLDPEQLASFHKMKPLLDLFSENSGDLNTILELAEEGVVSKKRELTNAFDAGMADYAKDNLLEEDYKRFEKEVTQLGSSGQRMPAMFKVAASAINNYQKLLHRGEQVSQGKVDLPQVSQGKVDLPHTKAPPADTHRVTKAQPPSVLDSLRQNADLVKHMFSSPMGAAPVSSAQSAADIDAKLAKTNVVVESSN